MFILFQISVPGTPFNVQHRDRSLIPNRAGENPSPLFAPPTHQPLQGALTHAEDLTPIGRMLAQLPVDIVVGKMLIMATIFHVSAPTLPLCRQV